MRSIFPGRCGCAFLLSVMVTGCASAPGWVELPPSETAGEVFFTGSGSDSDGNAAKAEEGAQSALVSAVTRYLGVRISSESTVRARATLTEYEAEITELITQESAAYVSDLRIADKHVTRNRDGAVIVHLLGAYERSALLAEKDRLTRLFAERIEAVAGPERQGDGYAASGDLYLAAVSYLASAAAALDSDIDNARVIFTRVIRKAVDAVSRISVRKNSGPRSATVGGEMTESFSVLVSGPQGPISGVPFEVSWIEGKPGGRTGFSAATVRTGADGVAAFDHPLPAVAGEGAVFISLSFAPQLRPLKLAANAEDQLVRGFERAVFEKRVEFRFQILSDSMNYEFAVHFVDILDDGGLNTASNTESGIYRALADAGFRLVPFTGGRRLTGLDSAAFISTVREEELTRARRVVYGAAEVAQLSLDSGVYLATVEAELKVVDIETGSVVYSLTGSRTARGRSHDAAVIAAFRELGEQLGGKLVRELP